MGSTERGGTGDLKVMRNSLIRVASDVTWDHGGGPGLCDHQEVTYVPKALQQQVSVITKGQADVPNLSYCLKT